MILNKLFRKKNSYNEITNDKNKYQGKKYGGHIEYYGLQNFWEGLSLKERESIKYWYSISGINGKQNPEEIDSPNIQLTSNWSVSKFLSYYSQPAMGEKNYDFSERLLGEALKYNPNPIDLHFIYNDYIDLYYKRRDEGEQWIDKCIGFCKRDIELFPKFKEAWIEEKKRILEFCYKSGTISYEELNEPIDFILSIPSFKRLAIIYEKRKLYDKAIEICKLAISYNLDDGTKGGFESRIKKLQKMGQLVLEKED